MFDSAKIKSKVDEVTYEDMINMLKVIMLGPMKCNGGELKSLFKMAEIGLMYTTRAKFPLKEFSGIDDTVLEGDRSNW